MLSYQDEAIYCLLNDLPAPPRPQRRSLSVSQLVSAALHELRSGDFKGCPIGTAYLAGHILALEFQARQNWCDGMDRMYLEIFLQDKEVNAEFQARIQESNARVKAEEMQTGEKKEGAA